MIMYHLGPQLGMWIMQVSMFSGVLINRFHCISMLYVCVCFHVLCVAVEGCTDAAEGDTSKCHSIVTWQRS